MRADYNENITQDTLLNTVEMMNIGMFVWNLQTDYVSYSKEWASIVGYDLSELEPHVSTWEKMVLPEDLPACENNLNKYIAGESELYEAEFRIVRKDGSIIWGHDKGKITSYSDDGKPLILCGVLQNITQIKKAEAELRDSLELISLAVEAAEIGVWDWDIMSDKISYSDKYCEMFGYSKETTTGTMQEWEARNHPDDLDNLLNSLNAYVLGETDKYTSETRVMHADGHYIWTRDVGRIVERSENGNPTRLVGGHINIDELKNSKTQLEALLSEIEKQQDLLEVEIEKRTGALLERDRLLTMVHEVSKNLLAAENGEGFHLTVLNCLEMMSKAFNAQEIGLWNYIDVDGELYTHLAFVYRKGEKIAYNTRDMRAYIKSMPKENMLVHQKDDGNIIVSYSLMDPEYLKKLESGIADDFIANVPADVRNHFIDNLKEFHSMLISPVFVENSLFGFIAVSDERKKVTYTDAQANILKMCGNLFANAVHKFELNIELTEAHEEALLSSKAKSNFLANMSHEIRTPLNAILGMSEIILRESEGGAAEEYAVEIKNASESLLTIINDILDISKIESGKLEIIELEYYITSLLNDVVSLSKIRLENKPVTFTTFIDSNIPAILTGDEIRLKQILLNLLSNAIKFTKKGNINFSASCVYVDDKAMLTFEVQDTGLGIKEHDMQRLFMQFERVDTKKNRNIEGTGLGLAITKQLCEMMGGTISVSSVWGEGSTFTVTVPQTCKDRMPIVKIPTKHNVMLYEAREIYSQSIKRSIENLGSKCTVCTNQSELLNGLSADTFDYLFTPSVHLVKIKNLKQSLNHNFNIVLVTDPGDSIIHRDTLTASLPINCIQLAGLFGHSDLLLQSKTKTEHFIAPDIKVLVVDDNSVNLKVAKGLLAPYKLNIDTAANGFLAIDMVKSNTYDLVFMDHMMPEMDGIDATIAIRKLDGEYYRNLPIIALTANAIMGARELFVKEGMNDFLAKPIEMQKLHSTLLKWIPTDKVHFITPLDKRQDPAQANDMVHELKIDGIDTYFGINLIGGSLEDYFDVLSAYYQDGLNKLDSIYAFYKEANFISYRIDVHAVKSASGSIGAAALADMAKELESAAIKEDMAYMSEHTEEFLSAYRAVLAAINDNLHSDDEADSSKAEGEFSVLSASIPVLNDAIDLLDIDVIEATLKECMKYTWKGEINALLQTIKQCTESFEYYNAHEPMQKIAEEAKAHYGA